MSHATLRPRGQITLPVDVREALHIAEGDGVEFSIDADGRVSVSGTRTIPADQAWFWTAEWQAGEREASAEVAAGGGRQFDSAGDFLGSLPE